jgi:CHAD domain-containing protein
MKTVIDDGYRLLAARYFRKQARQLAEQLDGVREAADIEFVHRARVASRRLRAATRLLGEWVSAKQAKRWRKEIRRVTRGLGDARDKDVQIEFLCKAFCRVEDPACCPGVAHLLMHLEYQRGVLQPKVVEAVNRLQASGVLGEMRDAADQALAEFGGRDGGVRTPAVVEHVRGRALSLLEELLSYQESLQDPEDQEHHHAMRIAAKRLRYTLEISKSVFDGQLEEMITAAKTVQTLLGEIHDCDVWDAHLDAFLEEERRRMAACFGSPRPFARVKVGLEYLKRDRCETRERMFQELIDYWQTLRAQRVWEELARIVRGEPQPGGQKPSRPPQTVADDAADRRRNGNAKGENSDGVETRRVHVPRPAELAASGKAAPLALGRAVAGS